MANALLPHEVEFWSHGRNIHDPSVCEGRHCPVHNPSLHHMRTWPMHWRSDRGILERICEHGIAHPDPSQFDWWRVTGQEWQAIHGCDGDCVSVRSR